MKIFYEDIPLSDFTVVAGKSYEAAEFLAEYLNRDMEDEIEVDEASVMGRHEIRVGVANSNVNRRLKFSGLERGGFIIKFALGNILIRADSEEGEMNGVLEFLRRYAGWRFYPRRYEHIKPGEVVLRERGGFSFTPFFASRGIDTDGVWEVRNHINNVLRETARVDFGGSAEAAAEEIGWVLDYSPCGIVVDAACPAGDGDAFVGFMNRVWDILVDDYPDAMIMVKVNPAEVSLPERAAARGNIGVKLVLGEADLRKYVAGWAGVTSRLEVEYVVGEKVDFHAAAEDFRFFADEGVWGVCVSFSEGEADHVAEYVLARLMWNPYLSDDEIDELAKEMGEDG